MKDQIPQFQVILPFVWIAGLITASVVYRRSRGKPVLFRNVPDASFIERTASGHSHRSWYTRLGGANNCLIVAVANGKLVVRPYFPFNLMFLPEMFGLEEEIPVDQIKSIELKKALFAKRMLVEYRDANGEQQSMTLSLKRPNEFLAALPRTVPIKGRERTA